jgi:CBS domain containing-hemolysin-like protein
VLRAFGLHAGTGESSFHSPQELKLLVAESHEAGLLDQAQQELVERVFNIGDRYISDIMTPRHDIEWVDIDHALPEILKTIRQCPFEQLLVARGSVEDMIGMVSKTDLLHQYLDGGQIDIPAVLKQPLVIHENTSVFRVLDSFKAAPVRLAIVIDEYGSLEGIVTQTDLLEAIAGDLAGTGDEDPDLVMGADGSLLIDGMMPAFDAFERLALSERPEDVGYHTVAGFALHVLQHIPQAGEIFVFGGWRFEIVRMDGRRIDKLRAIRIADSETPG